MKRIVFSAAILMASFGASAQGFYGDINVGYGFGFPGRLHNDGTGLGTSTEGVINVNAANQERQTVLSSNKSINHSAGAGINLQLTPGYMFNDHFGIELGINYYLGSEVTVLEANRSMNLFMAPPMPGVEIAPIQEDNWAVIKATTKSGQLRLIPTLVFSTGASKKFSGYAKMGLVVPVAGSSVITISDDTKAFVNPGFSMATMSLTNDGIVTNSTVTEQKVKANFTVGFKGAIGVNYMVSEKIGIFAEAFLTSLQLSRKSGEYIRAEYNGQDLLPEMTTFEKEINYVSELDATSNTMGYGQTNIEPSKAQSVMTSATNFNQLGLAVGVKFNF